MILSWISKPTVMMEMTRNSNRKNSKKKHEMRPVRPPEEEMNNKEKIEGEKSGETNNDYKDAEKKIEGSLRLVNLLMDKIRDIVKLQQNKIKEFQNALGEYDTLRASKTLEQLKELEVNKLKLTNETSFITEKLDHLTMIATKFNHLREFSVVIRYSLSSTEKQRNNLEFLSAHTTGLIPRLESNLHDYEDLLERATERDIDLPTWEKADLLPVTKEMRAVRVVNLHYADMKMVSSLMENTTPIYPLMSQVVNIWSLSHAVEMDMNYQDIIENTISFDPHIPKTVRTFKILYGKEEEIVSVEEMATMRELGLIQDMCVKIIGNFPKRVPRKVLRRTTVTPNYKFRKKYISTIYGQLFDKMDNRKEFAWIILRENTRNIVCEHVNEAFIGSVKGTILVELMVVAFNIIIPFDRGKMINR